MTYYNLAIIGNGYDLHYKQPTSYYCFYKTLKEINELSKEDFRKNYLDRSEPEIFKYYKYVKGKNDNFFYKYFLSYNQIFENWNSFESELLIILNYFEQLLLDINNNIEKCFVDNNKIIMQILENYEVINIVNKCKLYEYHISLLTGEKYLNLKIKATNDNKLYVKGKVKEYIKNFPYELYKELKEFSEIFIFYLKTFVKKPSKQEIIEHYNIHHFLVYNYTNLIDNAINGSICHIHGNIKKNNIVFGVDSQYKNLERFDIFSKRIQRVMNKTNIPNSILNEKSSRIIIIGHSLDEADDDSLKLFLNNSNNYQAIDVYYYPKDPFATASLSKNLIRILGADKFDKLYNLNILNFLPLDD